MLVRSAAVALSLAALALGCGDDDDPNSPPAPITVDVTVVGSLRFSDGSPVVGATIYKYPTLLSPSEPSTTSNADGNFSLSFEDRCFADGPASGIGITPPVSPPSGGGECSGTILCRSGTQRRDCVFELAPT
jgi:hypothetical protein